MHRKNSRARRIKTHCIGLQWQGICRIIETVQGKKRPATGGKEAEDMAEKPVVTNAMRLLRAAGVAFSTMTYEVDEQDLSGVTVAKKTGMKPEEVFKTLVLRGERQGVMVCVIPVELEVDLKKLAHAAGDKKVEMTPMRELLSLTGYIRGGCSPIGMKKKYPTYIDETCLLCGRIAVSAGQRGVQLVLDPEDLIRYTDAVVCDVT